MFLSILYINEMWLTTMTYHTTEEYEWDIVYVLSNMLFLLCMLKQIIENSSKPYVNSKDLVMFLLKRKKNLNIYILKKTFSQTFDNDCNYQIEYVRYYFMIFVFRQTLTKKNYSKL